MRLVELVRDESGTSWTKLLALASLAGVCNALVLAIINAGAQRASDQALSFWYLAQFSVVILLYAVAQRYVMATSAAEVERVLHRIRVRLTDKVRHAELRDFEHIGRAELYASLHRDTSTISQSALTLLDGAQSALLVFFTTLYIASLSRTAFVLTVGFASLAVSLYFQRRKQLQDSMRLAAARENQLFETLSGLLDGFKAVRLHRARSDELFEHVREISDDAMRLKLRTRDRIAGQFVFAQVAFFLLLATMVFVVPRFSATYGSVVVKTTTAVLFLIGPIGSLVGAIPVLAQANAAAESIEGLESRLDRSAYHPPPPDDRPESFRQIRLEGVSFHYADRRGVPTFGVGPVDLVLEAGQVVFIAGGNGSGKSTLLKLITGLYAPERGVVRRDGRVVDEASREAYHDLFAVVFSDFHLFRRLYGIRAASPERVAELLRLMELEDKTAVKDREFETLELSNGQRKRVALLVSFLEDRPVLVFDEWAADQDPAFRRKFYEELLPELKRQGKTVVAVTHDDRYFAAADRLVWMTEGRLEERRP